MSKIPGLSGYADIEVNIIGASGIIFFYIGFFV